MYKTIEGDEIVVGGVYEDRQGSNHTIAAVDGMLPHPIRTDYYTHFRVKDGIAPGLIRRVDKLSQAHPKSGRRQTDIVKNSTNRPANDWIENTGTMPDLPEGTLVDCKYLNGIMKTNVGCIDDFPHKRWEITSDSYSITHYRIHKPEVEKQDVDNLLDEREKRYGQFKAHTEISQGIKLAMHQTPQWNALKPHQKESLDMIAHKIARILNGDPDYPDNWRDISGYSELVVRELSK
jgi:hypothetical protein